MIDIISLVISIGGLAVAILSHIRHSECFGIKIDTRSAKNTPPSTPAILETQPLLHNSPAILQPTDPIPIPEKKIFTRQNYL